MLGSVGTDKYGVRMLELLEKAGGVIRLDMTLAGEMEYYNGLVFQGYLKALPRPLLKGGRYDLLMQKFTPGAGAIGFAVYLDELDRLSAPLPPVQKNSTDRVMLNVALPKGRLGDKVYNLLAGIGYGCPEDYNATRKLVVENPEAGIRYFLVKPSDVAIYVEHGAADIGIVGKDILTEIEERERAATGIRTLKVGYNRVFGYYIEVSKGQLDQVPAHYIRKQTLTTGERYITEELKKVESDILGANDKILALEQAIFGEVREFIGTRLEAVQAAAAAVAAVDVLCSYAQASIENGYVKPEMTLDSVIEIRGGRHPVIEKMLTDHPFTPNDTYLDTNSNRLMIITGPNMSGKSTFMRQTAIIVLMAQIGCFVPAEYAKIGVVDKIFTRVGASDDLTSGQSTFMVEMNEVAEILKNATKKSLVILDEIGRGTSTFDGISIAKAVAEYISGKAIGCKTLFATHYHELISMEKEYDGIRNFSVAAVKRGDELRFLHKICEGGTDDSYGIEVAKLAGLPQKVINRAKEELVELEKLGRTKLSETIEKTADHQFSFTAINEQNAIAKLRAADINTMSPMDALMFLKDIKDTL